MTGESLTTAPANTQHKNARIARVPPIAHLRLRGNRSRNGPIRGATIANGSIVNSKNDATCPSASSVGTVKKRVPASDTAMAASPAALNACGASKRESPLSPAPWAWVKRRGGLLAPRLALPMPLPVATATRAVAWAARPAVSGTLRVRDAPALLARRATGPADAPAGRRGHPRWRLGRPSDCRHVGRAVTGVVGLGVGLIVAGGYRAIGRRVLR